MVTLALPWTPDGTYLPYEPRLWTMLSSPLQESTCCYNLHAANCKMADGHSDCAINQERSPSGLCQAISRGPWNSSSCYILSMNTYVTHVKITAQKITCNQQVFRKTATLIASVLASDYTVWTYWKAHIAHRHWSDWCFPIGLPCKTHLYGCMISHFAADEARVVRVGGILTCEVICHDICTYNTLSLD